MDKIFMKGKPLDGLFGCTKPAVEIRMLHFDLKGVPPTFERFIELLHLAAAARYNALLMEWEDTFPWTVDEQFRSPTAYSTEQVEKIHATAVELGMEIIPLVQCLGHTEMPLRLDAYEHLRAMPHRLNVLNPLDPASRQLVCKMIDDVIALSPKLRYLHLGGDEADGLDENPQCAEFVEKHGKGALYLHHVEPILDKLNAARIRPILWHDMMIEWSDQALEKIGQKADLMVWGYHEHPDVISGHYNTKYIKRFVENKIPLWAALAYKGADGPSSDLPILQRRAQNALDWIDVASRFDFKGIAATAWSRYNSNGIADEPIDSALDSLLNVAAILHDGKAPAGGIDACVEALDELGEKERFLACKGAMEKLSSARAEFWKWSSVLREILTASALYPFRPGPTEGYVKGMKSSLASAEQAADAVRQAFAGLIEPCWIQEYLSVRIEAMREQYKSLLPPVFKNL